MKSFRFKRPLVALTIAALAFCTSACGSDDQSFTVNSNQNVNVFAARYLGTGTLGGTQKGNLDVSFDPTGNGTGTFTVVNTQVLQLANGSISVSGRVDVNTGSFNLTGSQNGTPIAINGVLPRGTESGFYFVSVNGQTFPGLIQNSSQGQPSDGGGTTSLITGGTATGTVFTPGAGYNGITSNLSNPVVGGVVVTGSSTNNLVTVTLTTLGSPIRNLGFGVITHGAALEVGHTYNVANSVSSDGAVISYQELNGTTVDKAWAVGAGTTGTVTITSLSSSSVSLNYSFSNIPVNSVLSPNNATGVINTISGQVTANLAP